MRITVKTTGLKQTQQAIQEFAAEKTRRIQAIVQKYASLIEGAAISLAPVDDGNLRNSIFIRFEDNDMTAHIVAGAHYAVYVEFGTGKYAVKGDGRKTPWAYINPKTGEWVYTEGSPAQPFLFPAYEQYIGEFIRELNKEAGG